MNDENEIKPQETENTSENKGEISCGNSMAVVKRKKGTAYYMREYILPIGFQALLIYLIIKFAIFLTVVPTGSMSPTVEPHSVVIATRMYNPEETVRRGDIIIFNSEELGEMMFKRVIGLPGEFVEILENGEILINGAPLREPYVKNEKKQKYQSFKIPEGCYFFLGDNRSGSFDAREWEQPYISSDEFVGEARFTIWPLDKFGGLK